MGAVRRPRSPGQAENRKRFICIILTSSGGQTWSRTITAGRSRVLYTLPEVRKSEIHSQEILVRHEEASKAAAPIGLFGFELTSIARLLSWISVVAATDRNVVSAALPQSRKLGYSSNTRLNPFGPVCNIDCSKLSRRIQLIQL